MYKIKNKVKIGIVGCGAIGEGIATFIDKELRKEAILFGVNDLDSEKAEILVQKLSSVPKILDIDSLIKSSELIIETASIEAAHYILKRAIAQKKDVIILSVGVFVKYPFLIGEVKTSKINVYIPSGAISGIDALGALSLGKIKKISLCTSKPVKSLLGTEYLAKKRIALDKIKKEKIIFQGGVEEAIKYFPQNINVSATLFLASSFKNVSVCIKANPNINRNIHHIEIDTAEAKININIENVPSKSNPKTSSLTILSTQYLLKKIFSSFKIGS